MKYSANLNIYAAQNKDCIYNKNKKNFNNLINLKIMKVGYIVNTLQLSFRVVRFTYKKSTKRRSKNEEI